MLTVLADAIFRKNPKFGGPSDSSKPESRSSWIERENARHKRAMDTPYKNLW